MGENPSNGVFILFGIFLKAAETDGGLSVRGCFCGGEYSIDCCFGDHNGDEKDGSIDAIRVQLGSEDFLFLDTF